MHDYLSDDTPIQEKWWKDICWQIAFLGYWEQQAEKQKRWGYVGSQLTIRNQIALFKRKLITRHIKL